MQSRHPIFIRKEKCSDATLSSRTPRKGNNFRAVGLFRRVEHGPCLTPSAQMLFNISAALAAAKTTAAGALHAGRRFRPFGGGGFDSPCINIVANAVDHSASIRECERLSISLRMICSSDIDVRQTASRDIGERQHRRVMLYLFDIELNILNSYISQ
jgi:hypothetical protein